MSLFLIPILKSGANPMKKTVIIFFYYLGWRRMLESAAATGVQAAKTAAALQSAVR